MILPRKSVVEAKRYVPPLEGRRGKVRLDFNENTAGFAWAAPGLPVDAVAVYPEYDALHERVSEHLGLSPDRVLLTNGSGEAIFLAAFAFLEPGVDRALTSRPTFSLIPHFLRIVGSDLVEVDVTPTLAFDTEALEAALAESPKIAVFASPDNPTGDELPPGLVLDWCARFPDTLFVLDEAYALYTETSLLPRAGGVENLVVLRTFSKAFGMAGLRLGVAAGPPDVLEAMARAKMPYSVNAAAAAVAPALLERAGEVRREARETMRRKASLLAGVAERGFATVPGHANFFLVRAGADASALAEFLADRGVLVRDRSSLHGLAGTFRVTVGTEAENAAFLAGLDAWRETHALIFDLDDTLVDTSRSYDVAVADLVRRRSDTPVEPGELARLRAGGGFNDDWDAAVELLRRRGVTADRADVERDGKSIYLGIARGAERLLVDPADLKRLAQRYRLFIWTGRTRDEYAPVWGATLDPLFEKVVCRDDVPDLPPKPAPDALRALLAEQGLEGGWYVGNSVDDMQAAAGAGIDGLGVETTLEAQALRAAGAAATVRDPQDVKGTYQP